MQPARPARSNGWTTARRFELLSALYAGERVATAAVRIGPSASSAYRLRKRDPEFAEAWETVVEARFLAQLGPMPSAPSLADLSTDALLRRLVRLDPDRRNPAGAFNSSDE